jgi:NAD(P)-dependent dehydrogenase (short-subunit alcohol dehydrogenase family)
MRSSPERRAALITGGSSGIGLAVAAMLADEGYALTLSARDPAKLAAAADGLRALGADVAVAAADLSDAERAAAVVADHEATYGRLDVLVQSAGIGFHRPLRRQPVKALDLEIGLNFRTPFVVLQAALPMLLRAGAEHRKALVVHVTSFNGVHPAADLASYSATKAALNALSRAAQAEVGNAGVQVTALCPGYVDTPMSDFWSELVPKAEMLRPSDLAEAVRFLLRTSPACRVPEIVLGRGGGTL